MRSHPSVSLAVLVLMLSVCGATGAAPTANSDPRWQQVQVLEEQGQNEAAEQLYAALLSDYPDSQKAAVKLAGVRMKLGHMSEALQAAEQAIAIEPFGGLWAEWAFLNRAKACQAMGQVAEARAAIAILKSRYPDAVSTARAAIIEAQLDGASTEAAEAAVKRELEADRQCDDATAAVNRKEYDRALVILDRVIKNYPETRKSLRARKVRAFVLSMIPGRTEEALGAFRDIASRLKSTAPHSVLAYEADYRIAALHQRKDMRREAMELYEQLAARCQDPNMAAQATWQAVGARNEMLQRKSDMGQGVTDEEWNTLRVRCAQLKALPHAQPLYKARVDLIVAESYHWQHATDQALAAAQHVITTYDTETDRSGVATARLIAGECLQLLGRHTEALVHYQWIIDEMGDEEIWKDGEGPGAWRTDFLASLARVRFRVYDALRQSGAPVSQVTQAGDLVVSQFPNSRYADLVRNGRAHGAP